MHFSQKAQIAHWKADGALTKLSSKYTDFIVIFLLKLAVKLPKYTEISNIAIELIDDWQTSYGPIYSLD